MNPILFSIWSIKFYTYGITIVLSCSVSLIISYLLLLDYKTKKVNKIDTLLYTALLSFIGSRLVYFLLYYNQFDNFWQMFYFWQNGLVAYGGMFVGTLFALWYLIKHNEKIWKWLDAMMIGFYGGFACGNAILWLLKFNPSANRLIWCELGLILLLALRFSHSKKIYPGLIFLLGFILFSLGQIVFSLTASKIPIFNGIISLIILFGVLYLLINIKLKRPRVSLWVRLTNKMSLDYLAVKQKWLKK